MSLSSKNSSFPLLLRGSRSQAIMASPNVLLFSTSYDLKQNLASPRAFLGRCTQVFHVRDLRVITNSDLRDQSERTCFSPCLPAGRRLRGGGEKGRDISVIKSYCGVKTMSHKTHQNPTVCVCAYEHLNGDRCDSTLHIRKVLLICHNDEQYASDTNSPALLKL